MKVDAFQQKNVSFTFVEIKDLPYSCPPPTATKWNMHPKIFLKFSKSRKAFCPYCGSKYELKN